MLYSRFDIIHELTRRAGTGVGNWTKRLWSYTKELARWINRNRTDLLHILTAIIVGLLFMGMIDGQNKSHLLITGEGTIIMNQSKQIEEQKAEISALSAHVDCLFTLATNPNHSTAYVADPATCGITSPPTAATPKSSAATAQVSQTSLKTNSGQTGATMEPQTSQNNSGNSTSTPKKCTAKILFICL